MLKAKPFIKWVGGKGQLLEQLEYNLPADFDQRQHITYVEPFVGGGAMLYHMLQYHKNIDKAIICDINKDLITSYITVRDHAKELIDSLKKIQSDYFALKSEKEKKIFFIGKRDKYNLKNLSPVENTTLFIFLNRTCFNGLYRVNKSGLFNVPFGKYSNPCICDERTIYSDSEILKEVEIINDDFEKTFKYAGNYSFYYFDPPYRPISNTSSFKDYSKEPFNDDAQIRLKVFCDKIANLGSEFMLSNSDCRSTNPSDLFFDELYDKYHISRVLANRAINSNPNKRGKLSEILVCRYNKKTDYINSSLFNTDNHVGTLQRTV
jgi:DNA adenine methylase